MLNVEPVFNRANYIGKSGTAKIHIRVIYKQRPYYYDLGVKVHPFQWNERLKKVIKHPKARVINDDVAFFIGRFQDYYRESRKMTSGFDVRRMFENMNYNRGGDEKFLDYVNRKSEAERSHLAESTLGKRQDLFGKIKRYDEEVRVNDIDKYWLRAFKEWLFKQKSHYETRGCK